MAGARELVLCVCPCRKPSGPPTMQPCSGQVCQVCPELPGKVCIATLGVALLSHKQETSSRRNEGIGQWLGLTWSVRRLLRWGLSPAPRAMTVVVVGIQLQ